MDYCIKRSLFLISLLSIACTILTGCKKWSTGSEAFDETDQKEDLSYLIKTYARYNVGNNIYTNTWTYDGYKEIGSQFFMNGQLVGENQNYSYDGLNASWDRYSYRNGDANSVSSHEQVECEYLDNTFLRRRYQKTLHYFEDSLHGFTELYNRFDGEKIVSSKEYDNGILIRECDYNYDGLHCNYISTTNSSNVVIEKRTANVVYLDDTYKRVKSSMCTVDIIMGLLQEQNIGPMIMTAKRKLDPIIMLMVS